MPMLLPGQKAPDFSLKDQYGINHRLSDYVGNWVVLFFYPKDHTPGCIKEVCSIRNDFSEIQKRGAEVLGINLDDGISHLSFSEKYLLTFPLLSDSLGETCQNYDTLWSLGPLHFVRRKSFIINQSGYIMRIHHKVKTQTHGSQLITDLDTLQTAHSTAIDFI